VKNKSGFTLIEILLVIAIIAILAAVVIVAINPSKQLADANNAHRHSDVRALHQAIQQYVIDNGVNMPNIPSELSEVCATGDTPGDGNPNNDENDCGDFIDLSELVPTYLSEIPEDPLGESERTFLGFLVSDVYAAEVGSGYFVAQPSIGPAIIVAPATQNIDHTGLLIQVGTTTVEVSHFSIPDSDSDH
jgi:prepilin-type N-terminal cleavage/methylation domain-containing protein